MSDDPSMWERRVIKKLGNLAGSLEVGLFGHARGHAGAIKKGFVIRKGNELKLTPLGWKIFWAL